MNKRRLAPFAGLALVVLAVGGANAAIPDAGGVFHACAKKTFDDDGTPRGKGELRLIDHAAGEDCNLNKETHIHFNERGQTGPQGEQGETGQQGPPGPPGSNATVEGFADTGSATTSVEDEVWDHSHLVLEEPVPAGSYLVTATVTGRVNGEFSLPPDETGGGVLGPRFHCLLRNVAPSSGPALFTGTVPLEEGGTVILAGFPARFFRESSVALTGAFTATEPTTPQVLCELRASSRTRSFAGNLRFDGSMTIVKVGSIG